MFTFDNYRELHEQVKKSVDLDFPKTFSNDDPKSRPITDALIEVERIRRAATRLIGCDRSEMAVDLLLCVANEARMAKTRRNPREWRDFAWFSACKDDKALYKLIHYWMQGMPY